MNKNSIYITKGDKNITLLGLNKSSAKIIPKNSIILSSRAPIGYLNITNCDISFNQGIKGIIPTNEVDTLYLYHLLKFNIYKIINMGSGTTFKEVSTSDLKELKIEIINNIEEQIKLVNILGYIDKKIEINNKINDNLFNQLKLKYSNLILKAQKNKINGK
ncbi:UNVERIFIED_CONTAM: restriction endonuclease subunit S [Campylobacter lari]